MSDVVFFGVKTGAGAGHYFHAPAGASWFREIDCPLPPDLMANPSPDGRWCYSVPRTAEQLRRGSLIGHDQTEGRGFIHHAHGWTIISWWDRSEDRRGGCNATFFVRGYHQWTEALRRAREAFLRDLARMEGSYPIALAGADLPDPEDDPNAAFEDAVCREVERLYALHPQTLAAVLRRMRGQ